MTQNTLGRSSQRAEFEKRPMLSTQNNQIDLFATSEDDDLFGGISLHYNLGHAAVAAKTLGYPFAESLMRIILR